MTSDPEGTLSDQTGTSYQSKLSALETGSGYLRAVYSSSIAAKAQVTLGAQASLREQDADVPIYASSILGSSNTVVFVKDYLSIENYGVFVLSNNSLATYYTDAATFDDSGHLVTYA